MCPYAKRKTVAKFQNFPPINGRPGAFFSEILRNVKEVV